MNISRDELRRRRTAMGRGILPWFTAPHMVGDVGERGWLLLSGVGVPDMNFGLIADDDPALLAVTVAAITTRELSALLMLADRGKHLAERIPEQFSPAGEMPIMSKPLVGEPAPMDSRVRRATADDRGAVEAVLAAAYGLPAEAVAVATEPLVRGDDGPLSIWLLEDSEEVVSAVTATRADDTVGLWTMATPPRHERKGFGRALLASVLAEAQQDGASLGLLGATPAGFPLYSATGWTTHETWELYVNAPSAQFA